MRLEKLNDMRLATIMGADEDGAASNLKTMAEIASMNQQNLSDLKTFFSRMTINQNKKTVTIHLLYVVVDPAWQVPKQCQIVDLKNQQFLVSDVVDIEKDMIEQKDEIQAFLKSHQIKQDMTKIFYLAEQTQQGYRVYLPVK